jgi:hypothetical protein
MTVAQATLIAVGVIAQVVTFALGVMVGSIKVKRKESHDHSNKDATWWHTPQVQRR